MHCLAAHARQFVQRRACRAFSSSTPRRSTVDEAEVRKFSQQASQWWDRRRGAPFAGLHAMNHVRVPFVVRAVHRAGTPPGMPAQQDVRSSLPLHGYRALDVGCGGGILSEALARVGASVTGIDASSDNIAAARTHAQLDDRVRGRVRYDATTAEALAATEPGAYDCVVASEVIEHVASPPEFMRACATLVKPGGVLAVTTLNRTAASMLLAILGAEYVLRIVPRGTHEWNKFITPQELRQAAEAAGLLPSEQEGWSYNPLDQTWFSTGSWMDVNYAFAAVKPV